LKTAICANSFSGLYGEESSKIKFDSWHNSSNFLYIFNCLEATVPYCCFA